MPLLLDYCAEIIVIALLSLFACFSFGHFYARLTYCALFSKAHFVNNLCFVSVVRTLTGHKSSIRGIDFHPYGEFVASGSLDTNVKVSNLG